MERKFMIGAGIVTYNPDSELLQQNIEAILSQVEQVILVDNASDNINDLRQMVQKYNIILLENKENVGIAKALNQIMVYFEKKKYQWVLTLDQDTVCPKDLITELKSYTKENVGIVSPAFFNRGILTEKVQDKPQYEFVQWTITSASLNNINAWKVIGGFDEKLFIDGVDIDYGIRLNKNDYKVIKVNTLLVSHMIGESKSRKVLGYTFVIKNHNATRKYYIARNTLIVAKKNKNNIIKSYFQVIKQIILVLVFESDKTKKLKSIIHGIIDANKYFER